MEQQGELWGRAPAGWADVQEPQHRPLWEAMLDVAEVDTGDRVLDAGCGAGGCGSRAVARGAHVTGLDAAEGMITLSQARVPSGDFQVGDLEDLPFADHTFDAVIAANSVQYSQDRVRALGEFARVVAPGGRVVAGLFGPQDGVAFAAVFRAMGNALPTRPSGGGPFELSPPGTLEDLFHQADLNVVDTGEVDCQFTYPDRATFWRGNVAAGPVQGMLSMIDEDTLRAAAMEAIEPFVRPDGRIVIAPNIFRWVAATH